MLHKTLFVARNRMCSFSPSAAQIRLTRVWTHEAPIGQAEFTVIIPFRQIDSFANL